MQQYQTKRIQHEARFVRPHVPLSKRASPLYIVRSHPTLGDHGYIDDVIERSQAVRAEARSVIRSSETLRNRVKQYELGREAYESPDVRGLPDIYYRLVDTLSHLEMMEDLREEFGAKPGVLNGDGVEDPLGRIWDIELTEEERARKPAFLMNDSAQVHMTKGLFAGAATLLLAAGGTAVYSAFGGHGEVKAPDLGSALAPITGEKIMTFAIYRSDGNCGPHEGSTDKWDCGWAGYSDMVLRHGVPPSKCYDTQIVVENLERRSPLPFHDGDLLKVIVDRSMISDEYPYEKYPEPGGRGVDIMHVNRIIDVASGQGEAWAKSNGCEDHS